MHQPCTGTKKNKISSNYPEVGPQVLETLFFFWCVFLVPVDVYSTSILFFGACAGLVTLTSQSIVKHQQKLKNTKPLDAPNLHRHKKKTNPHFPTPIQKWAYSCWKICFFFGACRCVLHFHFVCFVFFGAFAGLVTLTSQNIGKHQKKTKNTKPLETPNLHRHQKKTKIPATTQKWAHSCWKVSLFF